MAILQACTDINENKVDNADSKTNYSKGFVTDWNSVY